MNRRPDRLNSPPSSGVWTAGIEGGGYYCEDYREWSPSSVYVTQQLVTESRAQRVRTGRVKTSSDCLRESSTADESIQLTYSSQGSFTSTWVVTTDSVNNACRFVRRYNRQYWNKDHMGEKYLIRAEIVW